MFNAYFVRLSQALGNEFSCNVLIAGTSLPATFKPIAPDLYMMFFKTQMELTFLQTIALKRHARQAEVLLPVLTKYNQRKLKKFGLFLPMVREKGFADILLELLQVDHFLEVERLLSFFSLQRAWITDLLVELEIAEKVKVIDFGHLAVVAFDHFRHVVDELQTLLAEAYEKRAKSLKLTDVVRQIKIPQESLFFRYLLRFMQQKFPLKLTQNILVFQKMPLSENEKTQMDEIERILRHNHLPVFSLEQVQKLTSNPLNQVNDVLWCMLTEGKIIQLNVRYFVLAEELGRILNRLKKYKRNFGDWIDIAGFRSLIPLSRKYIIVLLEYLDSQRVTQRQGNRRKILLNV